MVIRVYPRWPPVSRNNYTEERGGHIRVDPRSIVKLYNKQQCMAWQDDVVNEEEVGVEPAEDDEDADGEDADEELDDDEETDDDDEE